MVLLFWCQLTQVVLEKKAVKQMCVTIVYKLNTYLVTSREQWWNVTTEQLSWSWYTHTHNRFTALLEYVRDHLGEQVPER